MPSSSATSNELHSPTNSVVPPLRSAQMSVSSPSESTVTVTLRELSKLPVAGSHSADFMSTL